MMVLEVTCMQVGKPDEHIIIIVQILLYSTSMWVVLENWWLCMLICVWCMVLKANREKKPLQRSVAVEIVIYRSNIRTLYGDLSELQVGING